MKSHGNWVVKFGVILLAALWLTMVAASWSEAADGGEYNFSWLDPDKKIYVLQNRKYAKAGRVHLELMGGKSAFNAYRSAFVIDPRISYYVNETWGFEVFYSVFQNSENDTFAELKDTSPNALPKVREVRSQVGIGVHYVPWYAKINVFNNILYFDWYFMAGLGNVNTALDTRTKTSEAASYKEQSIFGYYLGTGQLYHLTQDFVARLDFTTSFYKAPLKGDTGKETYFSNSSFALGFGVKL